MTLHLPADAEPFLSHDDAPEWVDNPATYALELKRPDDLAEAWDSTFENRPPYFEELQNSDKCLYVGAAKDLLARLTDHKDGEKRLTVLTEVCEIRGLWGVWWFSSAEKAFERESGIATELANEMESAYVHQR